MIADVRLDGYTPAELPAKFEAGTPPITEVIGLGAAIDYLERIGMGNIRKHEMELGTYVRDTLTHRFGDDITIYGPTNSEHRSSCVYSVPTPRRGQVSTCTTPKPTPMPWPKRSTAPPTSSELVSNGAPHAWT